MFGDEAEGEFIEVVVQVMVGYISVMSADSRRFRRESKPGGHGGIFRRGTLSLV